MSFLKRLIPMARVTSRTYCRSRPLLLIEQQTVSFLRPSHVVDVRSIHSSISSLHLTSLSSLRCLHTSKYRPTGNTQSSEKDENKKLTVFQRFTQVYKEYGKTLIAVHVITSIAWYGGFYVIARSGIDLLPLLVKLGASEAMQAKYAAAGDFLVAYLLYEIAKPVRYLATLAATRQAVVYLRRVGYLPPIEPENKLRSLAKDGKDNLKDKYQLQRAGMRAKYTQTKAKYRKVWRNAKDRVERRSAALRHRHNGQKVQKSNGLHYRKKKLR